MPVSAKKLRIRDMRARLCGVTHMWLHRPDAVSERNWAITRKTIADVRSLASVAAEYGITPLRIAQICAKTTEEMERPRPRWIPEPPTAGPNGGRVIYGKVYPD